MAAWDNKDKITWKGGNTVITSVEANMIERAWDNEIRPQIVALESRMKEMNISGDHREELGKMVGNLTLTYLRIGLKNR